MQTLAALLTPTIGKQPARTFVQRSPFLGQLEHACAAFEQAQAKAGLKLRYPT